MSGIHSLKHSSPLKKENPVLIRDGTISPRYHPASPALKQRLS
ncbi:hypothetical protein GY50_0922 [Dehalococcoides mccartyi GY50]|nr:hypothetical protein GY50_0922 [Dehalococcoides mccartyi GY50]